MATTGVTGHRWCRLAWSYEEAATSTKGWLPAPALRGRQHIIRHAHSSPLLYAARRMRSRVTCVLPCVLTGGTIDGAWTACSGCCMFVWCFFREAEQASLHLVMVEVRSGSCEWQEVVTLLCGCSAGPDGKLRLMGPHLSIHQLIRSHLLLFMH